MLRMKELWLGQVVRTGTKGFGFVQLQGPEGASLRFNTSDFVDAGSPQAASPHVGEPVMVLLSDDARTASKVWKLRNGAPAPNGNGAPSPRRRGTITAVKSPDWGFLTDEKTNQAYFIHRTDLVGGGPLIMGQRVTFLPADTPKGKKACEVRIGMG
jgi:cold shock CspA family protein